MVVFSWGVGGGEEAGRGTWGGGGAGWGGYGVRHECVLYII